MDWDGCPAVNGIEPRNLCFLLDSAEALGYVEGNTGSRVMASGCWRPGVEGPFALHTMSARQPVRSLLLLSNVDEYARQAEEAREANGGGEVGRLHSTAEAGRPIRWNEAG